MCKQTIDQSQLSDGAKNCRRIEMVSIRQISCATRQKLGNLRSQTGKVAQLCCVSDISLMQLVADCEWCLISATCQRTAEIYSLISVLEWIEKKGRLKNSYIMYRLVVLVCIKLGCAGTSARHTCTTSSAHGQTDVLTDN